MHNAWLHRNNVERLQRVVLSTTMVFALVNSPKVGPLRNQDSPFSNRIRRGVNLWKLPPLW
jgi:hypothetical protein